MAKTIKSVGDYYCIAPDLTRVRLKVGVRINLK